MKEAKSKITTKKSGNGGYKSAWIYIPSKIYKSENFPFQDDEEVVIEIEEGSITISKNDERSRILRNFGVENATLPRLLEIKAKTNKFHPFLYFKDTSYSYQEINYNSNKIAHGIIELTNQLDLKAPKVSLLMETCPEFIFTWFGIAKTGCVFIPIDTMLSYELIEHIVKDSDTEILIMDYKFLRNYPKLCKNLPKIKKILIRNAPVDFNFQDIYTNFESIVTENIQNPKINMHNEDPIEILYSEGATGKPKGVVYRNVLLAGIALGYELREIGFDEVSKIYCPMSLSSSTAHFFVVLPSIFYDKSLIITENFNTSTFWEEIHKFQPDCFCYFGSHLTNLLYQQPQVNDRVHSVKFAFGFGAGIDLWKNFEERFGIPLHECWSHTEGIGVTINKLGSEGGKIGSIGIPLDFIELKIVDSLGKELPPGPNNIGEIAVRRNSGAIFEYYRPPEKTDVLIGKDNWIYSGDFGYTDYDGYVYYKGKRNEIITKGNELIYTKDIERVANSHPNIIESSVIPIWDEDNASVDFKIIAVHVKNRSITHEELSEYLFRNLAYFHVPRYIEFIEELPQSSGIEFLREVSKQEWENGTSKNKIWDSQIRDFLRSTILRT
ncbi:MAG: AMP-binding protein [Candidatus Hodarchaeales archaeon]|jgi:crotonobetaine/carnitine-CoA ligase